MKYACYTTLVTIAILVSIPCIAKRPKKEKHNTWQSINNEKEHKESHYQPNPVILAGVGQIMNGALSIAQDPHSRPNIGHSVASMVHGIMSIVIEKVAHKKIDVNDPQALEDCFNELYMDINKEITEIISTKNFSTTYVLH